MARIIDRLKEVASKNAERMNKAQTTAYKMKMVAEAAKAASKAAEIQEG